MIEKDVKRICDLIASRTLLKTRTVVAIAGPPASGKSTIAKAVVDALNTRAHSEVPFATLVPMDGFHLDNKILEARGLLARKGAPETFDAHGFCRAIQNMADAHEDVFFPEFDRARDLAIANAIFVDPDTPVVVVEGNYLLMAADPWISMHKYFAATVFLRPAFDELHRRLCQRWVSHGFDENAAKEKAEFNDIPNAKRVLQESIKADLNLA